MSLFSVLIEGLLKNGWKLLKKLLKQYMQVQ